MLKQHFFSYTQEYKDRFETFLKEETHHWKAGNRLQQALVYALENGGKRFRPTLVLMLGDHWNCCSSLFPLALAVEYFHTASLLADDLPCMDDASERRGKASLHRVFGEDLALLASYALISEGYKNVSKAFENQSLSAEKKAPLLSEAIACVCDNTGLKGAVGGQFLDMHCEDFSPQQVEETLKLKTVTLFELPLALAWLGGQQSLDGLEEIRALAFHFGLAFQLADDLLDLDEDKLAGRSMNWGVLFGESACREKLQFHAQSFSRQAKELGLNLPAFAGLQEYFLSFV